MFTRFGIPEFKNFFKTCHQSWACFWKGVRGVSEKEFPKAQLDELQDFLRSTLGHPFGSAHFPVKRESDRSGA